MKVRVWWASSSISSSSSEQEEHMHFMLGALRPRGPVWLGCAVTSYSRPTQPVSVNATSSGSSGGGDVPATDGIAGWRLMEEGTEDTGSPREARGCQVQPRSWELLQSAGPGELCQGGGKFRREASFQGYENIKDFCIINQRHSLNGIKGTNQKHWAFTMYKQPNT